MVANTTVALVGRQALVLEGLKRLLAEHDFTVTSTNDHPAHLPEDGDSDEADLVLLVDGDHTDNDLAALKVTHARRPTTKLVILRDSFDLEAVIGAFDAGVCGYIVKDVSSESLIYSLRLVAMGEKVFPSRTIEAFSGRRKNDEDESSRRLLEAKLSARERQILECLAVGNSNKVISGKLDISVATVKVHVKAILRKMHVQNRTQAAIYGINGGLQADGTMIQPSC